MIVSQGEEIRALTPFSKLKPEFREIEVLKINLVIISVLFFSLFQQNAYAQEPKTVRGIIAEHCIDCHRVPGFLVEGGAPQIEAPDFQEIADNPKIYSRQRLEIFLSSPHFPMRNFILSKSDIQNLIAYIDNLRSQSSRP